MADAETVEQKRLVARGMVVVRRLLAEREGERQALQQRFHEWNQHPIGRENWRENVDIFVAGYRLGLRGSDHLNEPYWRQVADEDGFYTDGPEDHRAACEAEVAALRGALALCLNEAAGAWLDGRSGSAKRLMRVVELCRSAGVDWEQAEEFARAALAATSPGGAER